MTVDEFLSTRLSGLLARQPPPGDVQLAVALSVATRIEPELIRAVRLKVLPHLNVGAESDFWFSDWVGVRNPHVVALRPGLLPLLREEFRQWFLDPDRHLIGDLGDMVEKVHVDLSPALVQEEKATWRWACGDRDAAQRELQQPLYSLREERREGIADWVIGAARRLPREVLVSRVGLHLLHVARSTRPADIEEPELPPPAELSPEEREWAAGRVGRISFPVSVRGGELLIGAASDRPDAATLPLPVTTPVWVEILVPGQTAGEWHSFRPGEELRVPGIPHGAKLRTADGTVYDLSPVASVEASASEIWLPSRLLSRVREVIPLDSGSLEALQSWRDQPEPLGIRLLLGWTPDERRRLADQFATDSERAQWRVQRARHVPGYPAGDVLTGAAGSQVLLVVDHVESWYYRALPELVDEIRAATDDPVRVLLLADALGPWWEALSHALSQAGIADATSTQHLPAPLGTRRERHMLFHRTVDEVALVMPQTARADVAPPPVLDFADLSVADIQILAVATALGSPTDPARLDLPQARRIILRREHEQQTLLHEQGRIAVSAEALAKLVFLAVLMQPLPDAVADAVAREAGVVSDEADWLALLAGFESCYPPARAGLIDPQWPDQLADALLGAVLVEQEPDVGVEHMWVADAVLARLGELGSAAGTVAGARHALGALARAGHTYPGLVTRWLLPFAWDWPGVVVAAGGTVLLAVAEYADVDVLERLHKAVRDVADRPVELDPADAVIAEKLIESRLRDATFEQQAALRVDLGGRLAKAGRLRNARDVTEQAVTSYQTLSMARPTEFLPLHADAVLQLSDQLGELGQLGPALERAEEAEDLARRRARMVRASEEGDLGSALAVVGRQRARAGKVEQALGAAQEAVSLLAPAARVNRTAYGSDLADALVSLSDRQSEADDGERALATAQRAVELCKQLSEANPRAHAARLAAALLALGRRHAKTGDVVDALGHIEQSVRLYQELARASSLRYEPLLAEAETDHAVALLEAGRSREALAAVASAIARLRDVDLGAHRPQLAWSLVQLARILVGLGSAQDASAPLQEALDIYQVLPSLRSKRDSDAISEAQYLRGSFG